MNDPDSFTGISPRAWKRIGVLFFVIAGLIIALAFWVRSGGGMDLEAVALVFMLFGALPCAMTGGAIYLLAVRAGLRQSRERHEQEARTGNSASSEPR